MKNQIYQVAQTKLQYKSAKNYFATLILALVLFFSFTESGEAQSTCPTGYTPITVVKSFGPNCTVTTYFCVKYLVVSGVVDVIQGNSTFVTDTGCGNLPITDFFWDQIYDELFKILCTQSLLPPCPPSVEGRTVQVTSKQCIRVVWVDHTDQSLGVEFIPCDSLSYICMKGYNVCCKPDGGIEKTLVFTYTDQYAACEPLWSFKDATPISRFDPPVCYKVTCK